MDIVAWLRGLGLDRYEAAFRENEIDWALLPKLTADDLKDLGVSLVGLRVGGAGELIGRREQDLAVQGLDRPARGEEAAGEEVE